VVFADNDDRFEENVKRFKDGDAIVVYDGPPNGPKETS